MSSFDYLNQLRQRSGLSPLAVPEYGQVNSGISPRTQVREDEEEEEMRELSLPDGSPIWVSSKYSDEEAMAMARERIPFAFEAREEVAPQEVDSGPIDALASSFQRATTGMAPGLQAYGAAISEDQAAYDEAQMELAQASEAAHEIAPGLVRTDDIIDSYENEGLMSATGKALEFGTEQIFSSVGRMLPAVGGAGVGYLAGGGIGALIGSLGGPLGTAAGASIGSKIGAIMGGAGTTMATYISEDLERSYIEGLVDVEDVNTGKTLVAAGGQTALDALGYMLLAPAKIASEPLKKAGYASVARFIDRVDNIAPAKRVLATLAEEEVAEIGQQALERWQAGLEVSPADEEAAKEYMEIAFATLFPAAGFGGMAGLSAKYTADKKLRAERALQGNRKDIVEIHKKIDEMVSQDNAQRIEYEAEQKASQDRNNTFWRQRASELVGGLREQYENIINNRTAVTTKDIHNIADDRNILWDDDGAFIQFSKRVTGKEHLDDMTPGELRSVYDMISAMPRQDTKAKLQYASPQEAIDLASRLGQKSFRKKAVTPKLITQMLGNGDLNVRDPDAVANEISQAYIDKMLDMGLIEPDANGKLKSSAADLGKISEQTYAQIMEDTSESGVFPSYKEFVSKYNIRQQNLYEKVRAVALKRGAIVERNGKYISYEADLSSETDGYQVSINGKVQPEWYSRREDAEEAVAKLYEEQGEGTLNPSESQTTFMDMFQGEPEASLIEAPLVSGATPRVIEVVNAPKEITSPEVVPEFEYDISSQSKKYVVRDRDGNVVKVFDRKSDANRYKNNADKNTFSYDVMVDNKLVNRFKDRKSAKKFIDTDLRAELLAQATARHETNLTQAGIFSPSLIAKQAAKRAESDVKKMMRGIKPQQIGQSSGYTFNPDGETGFVLTEVSRDDSGKAKKKKTLGFYESEASAKRERTKRYRGRVGRESIDGKIGSDKSARTAAERTRLREDPESIASEAIPDVPLRSIEVENTRGRAANLPEGPKDQQTFVDSVTSVLNRVLKNRSGTKDFQVNLSRSLKDETGQSSQFVAATNTINLAYDPALAESKSVSEAAKALAPSLNEGSIHAFRQLGMFKAKEWNSLSRYIGKKRLSKQRFQELNDELIAEGKSPLPENATYLDYQYNKNEEKMGRLEEKKALKESLDSGALTEEQYNQMLAIENARSWIKDDYVEAAVAMAFSDFSQDLTNITGQPRGLLNRAATTLQAMGNTLRGRGFVNAEQVFQTLYGEQMGARLENGKALDTWYSNRPGAVLELEAGMAQAQSDLAAAKEQRRQTLLDQGYTPEQVDAELGAGFGEVEEDIAGSEAGFAEVLESDKARRKAERVERARKKAAGEVDTKDDAAPEVEQTPPVDQSQKNALNNQSFSRILEDSDLTPELPPGASDTDQSASNAAWFNDTRSDTGKDAAVSVPAVLVSGYHENSSVDERGATVPERGIGIRHIEQHEEDIRTYTPYENWREMLTDFSSKMNNLSKSARDREIEVYNEPDSTVYVWNNEFFDKPVVITTFNAKNQNGDDVSYIATAYPADSVPDAVGNRRDKSGHLNGRGTSLRAWRISRNPSLAERLSPSERARRSVTATEGRPVQQKNAMDRTLAPYEPKNIFQSINSALTSWDSDKIDKITQMMMDKYKRLETYGKRAAEMAKERGMEHEWVHNLFATSAHAMALMSEKAKAFSATSFRDGMITYKNGVPVVEKNPLVNTARVRYLDEKTGKLSENYNEVSAPDLYEENAFGGLLTALDPISTKENNLVPELMFYMIALREYRLKNERGKSVSMSDEDIKEGLRVIRNHPEVAVVAQNLQNLNEKLVEFQVATGLLTPELAQNWISTMDYVPLMVDLKAEEMADVSSMINSELDRQREMIRPGGITGAGISKRYEGIAEGKKVKNPIEAIAEMTERVIATGLENVASQRALRDAVFIGEAQEISKGRYERANGLEKISMAKIRHQGDEKYFIINDVLLHEVLKGSFDGRNPAWVDMLAKPANVLRSLVTRSPEYLIANMLRDSLSVYTLNGGNSKPIIDATKTMASNLYKMRKGEANEHYTTLQRLGAIGGYEQAELTGDKMLKRYFSKKTGPSGRPLSALKAMWDYTGELSSRSESATRENVYEDTLKTAEKKYLDMGFEPEVAQRKAQGEAGWQAIEVLNFSRRGSNPWVQAVSATVPFLNSRMQGLGVMARAMRGTNVTGRLNDPEVLRKTLINRAATLASISAIYALLSEMDEERDNLQPYVKDDYWLVPITFENKRWLAIPIPFEAGVAFKTIPEMLVKGLLGGLTDGKYGNTWQDTKRTGIHAAVSTLNINPIPQAVRPVYEWFSNKNMFTGNPIVPHWQEKMPAEYQVGDMTTAPSMMVSSALSGVSGGALQVSPRKLDNTLKTLFGGIGIYAIQAADNLTRWGVPGMPTRPGPRVTDLPLVRRFVKDEFGGGLKNDLYSMGKSIDGMVQAIKDVQETDPGKAAQMVMDNQDLLAARGAVNAIEKQLSNIRNARSLAFRQNRLTKELDDQLDEQELMAMKMVPNLKRMVGSWRE